MPGLSGNVLVEAAPEVRRKVPMRIARPARSGNRLLTPPQPGAEVSEQLYKTAPSQAKANVKNKVNVKVKVKETQRGVVECKNAP